MIGFLVLGALLASTPAAPPSLPERPTVIRGVETRPEPGMEFPGWTEVEPLRRRRNRKQRRSNK